MKTCLVKSCRAAFAALVLASAASALTLNDPGVVGIKNGLPGDTGPEEAGFAQHILDMTAGTLNQAFGGSVYSTSNTEYSGTVIGPGTQSGVGAFSVPAGWNYALAKYDGQNGGYVLFYLGGAATVLPEFSFSIWGDNSQQYQISHFTTFNPGSNVPDGGSTIAMMGAGMMLLAGIARRTLSFAAAA